MKKYVAYLMASAGVMYIANANAGTIQVDPATGLAYEFVSAPGISQAAAQSLASSQTYNGQQGYLAAITSQEQLNFIENSVVPGGASGTANIYVGGVRVAGSTATWEWGYGPNAGTIFWNNGPVAGQFAAWDPVFALGGPATPNSVLANTLYLNAWFRPYFTSAWPWATAGGIYAGGNSGIIVEFSPPTPPAPNVTPGTGLFGFGLLLLMLRTAARQKRTDGAN